MTTFWERAAHLVNDMFSLFFGSFPHSGFKGGTLVLIAPVPGHCFPFTFASYLLARGFSQQC